MHNFLKQKLLASLKLRSIPAFSQWLLLPAFDFYHPTNIPSTLFNQFLSICQNYTKLIMNSLPLSCFPFLNLLCILLLFQSSNGIIYADEFYKACQNSFSCGSTIEIGYPFRGTKEPPYCGYPGFVLSCEEDSYANVTTIEIMNVKYRVLDINQHLQTMRIAREDIMGGTCPEDKFNSTLDFSVFNYTSTYLNITFLYNCPGYPPGALPVTCGKNGYSDQTAYVINRTRGPGSCDSSVTVPCTGNIGSGKSFTQTELNQVLQQGIEIKWKVSSQPCNDCSQSRGRCGYDLGNNQTTCFCPNAPYVNNTCSMASGASPEEAPTLTPGKKSDNNRVGIAVGLSIGGAVLFGLGLAWLLFCCQQRRKLRNLPLTAQTTAAVSKEIKNPSSSSPLSTPSSNVKKFLLTNGSLAPKEYSYNEIKRITKSFSDKLGQGGYGIVYKGWLHDGQVVAVKVLTQTDDSGEEFINEVASISRTSHINIVNLLGFCHDRRRRALVYEFMPNKSLDKFIYMSGQSNPECQLELKMLYDIGVSVAKGLEYLHRGCNTRIVHFDIKPHNILLDKNFCPKISDFGLAKLFKKDQSIISLLGTRGTIGYIAPEVFSRNFGTVSHKSDVYSYGMVLLDMSGARRIDEMEATKSSDNYFFDKIFKYSVLNNNKSNAFGALTNEEDEETARKMLLVGLWCTQTAPSDRPSMNKVVQMLEGSLQSIPIPPKPILSTSTILAPQSSSTFSIDVHTQDLTEDRNVFTV